MQATVHAKDTDAWHRARRLVVVRSDNIGDVIMAGPVLRALKAALPAVELTLLASPAGAKAAPLLPWLDSTIVWRVLWQDLGALPFDPARERSLIHRLRRRAFDGAMILSSFSQSPHAAAFAACLADIPLRAGSSRNRSGLLTHAVDHGDDAWHQVDRNLALVEALGFRVAERELACEIPAYAETAAEALLESRGIGAGEPYVLYNPWSSAPARTFPPERAADAMRRIAAAAGLPVLITARERRAAEAAALARIVGRRARDLAGMTSVAELAALVARATLVVSGNTSVMHMADALRRPVLALYSGSDLESQWVPRSAPTRVLRRPTGCSPCYAIDCPRDLECLDLGPEEVAEAALELLARVA